MITAFKNMESSSALIRMLLLKTFHMQPQFVHQYTKKKSIELQGSLVSSGIALSPCSPHSCHLATVYAEAQGRMRAILAGFFSWHSPLEIHHTAAWTACLLLVCYCYWSFPQYKCLLRQWRTLAGPSLELLQAKPHIHMKTSRERTVFISMDESPGVQP